MLSVILVNFDCCKSYLKILTLPADFSVLLEEFYLVLIVKSFKGTLLYACVEIFTADTYKINSDVYEIQSNSVITS
jgi:hypothetical protein